MKVAIENWSDLTGKTIEAVFDDDAVDCRILTFMDGTYAAIQSERGWDGEREFPTLTDLNPSHPGHAERLVKYGIMSLEDQQAFLRRKEVAEQRERALREDAERAQYERLKAKFGG